MGFVMSAGAFLPPFLVVVMTTAALAQWPLPGWLLDQAVHGRFVLMLHS
jgi:hypothetical protein